MIPFYQCSQLNPYSFLSLFSIKPISCMKCTPIKCNWTQDLKILMKKKKKTPLPGLALHTYGEGEAFIEIQFVKNRYIMEPEPKVSHQYLKSPCKLLSQAITQSGQSLLLATSTVPKYEYRETNDYRVHSQKYRLEAQQIASESNWI